MRLYYTTDEKRSPVKHQHQYVFNGNEMIWRDRVIAEHKPAMTAVDFYSASRKPAYTADVRLKPDYDWSSLNYVLII